MTTLERVMRVMTYLNIGATLATAAWILWFGQQVVSGEWRVAPPAAPAPLLRLPAGARPDRRPCCRIPADELTAAQRLLLIHDDGQRVAVADTGGPR